jgi:hypothetical protein
MRQAGRIRTILASLTLLVLGVLAVQGEPIHRNPLGVGGLQFVRGPSSVQFQEREHSISREYAHKGDVSETIRVSIAQGDPISQPYVYYVYQIPSRAPLSPELRAGLWLRSKSQGVQLFVRVVLPHVHSAKSPDTAYTTLLEGSRYANTNNWQRLEIGNVANAMKQKVQALRLELGVDIDTTDAYVDQILLNLCVNTAGDTQVWINELEVGPVLDDRHPDRVVPATTGQPNAHRRSNALVEINRDQLMVEGKPFFIRGIRLTDTPVQVHKLAGFNALFLDSDISQATLDEVAKTDLFAIPTLKLNEPDQPQEGLTLASRVSGEDISRDSLTKFTQLNRLLFWYLGGDRGAEQVDQVSRAAAIVREVDPDRPIGVNAWDGLWPYSRNVDLLGVYRWPLNTSLDLAKYREWLMQRRVLERPGTFSWTWIQTHLTDRYTQLVYDRPASAAFDEPIGPQPEQIRLLTYIALSTGCHGLGFWSDRFLALTHQGRDRLLAVALLNLELQMLEPLLLSAVRAPQWIETSNPNVKAAVLFGDKGILVLPIWMGEFGQCVPGQEAVVGLKITVPLIPSNYNCWEINPAELRSITPKRVAGGSEITLPDFSLTAAVAFTSDVGPEGLLAYWQDLCRRSAKPASEWSIDLAQIELSKVRIITDQIAQVAPTVTGTDALLRNAESRIRTALSLHDHLKFQEAYAEANRAMRPIRQLMNYQWHKAVADLGTPVATPYSVGYYTLPRHWAFMNAIKRATPGDNQLHGGNFESPDQSWSMSQTTLDEVKCAAFYSNNHPHLGTSCLELNVKPKDPEAKPAALERTFVAVTSPAVQLPPGTIVRISFWMRIPEPITASADGALFYDNVGGEPLSVRLTDKMEWKQFTLYRKVPVSGQVFVTMALTGLGTAQFDDVKIEPMYDRAAASNMPTPNSTKH